MHVGLRSLASLALAGLPAAPALAQFQTNVTITNANAAPVTQTLSLSDLTASRGFAAAGNSPALNSAYNGLRSGINATIQFNNQTASFSVPANSSAVTVNAFGSVRTFDAGTRLSSLQAAVNSYLANAGNSINGPNVLANPSVGNPQSLAGRMTGRDFTKATGIGGFDQDGTPGGAPSTGHELVAVPNALTAGGEVSYASAGGVDLTSVTVPIDYAVYFADPRYSVTLDVPLTYLKVGNADVAQGSFGATFKFPVLDNWSLGVTARGGILGSQDLLLGTYAYSAGIASQYLLFFGDIKVTVGNSVGLIETKPFKVGAYTTGPSRTNVPIVNGVSVEGSLPFTLFDKPTSYEAYIVDTYYAGQSLAIDHYDEIGFNLGTRRRGGDQSWNSARIGLAYTVGRSFNMVSLRASYKF